MDPSVGHLNGILAWVGGNLNNNFQKKSNARGVARGGGMLKLRFDRYITVDDQLTDWLIDGLADCRADLLSDWLTDWLIHELGYQLADLLSDWLANLATHWLFDWLNGWLFDRLTLWLTVSLNEWLTMTALLTN